MKAYYFELNGNVERVEIPDKELKVWKESNPHVELIPWQQFSKAKREKHKKQEAALNRAISGRMANMPFLFEAIDELMNWAADSPEVKSESLKKFAQEWEARK